MPTDPSTYPPLDVLKSVAANIWIVDSGPLWLLGMPIPLRMTVMRLNSGDIMLHSPTRWTPSLQGEIERRGYIRHLVAPTPFHWSFIAEWKRHCAGALVWAAPCTRERRAVRKEGLSIDRELSERSPEDWRDEVEQAIVPARFLLREFAFFHRPSRTAILTDLVVNLEWDKIPLLRRPGVWALGALAPHGKAPLYTRTLMKMNRRQAAAAAARILNWAPERVIFSHGSWFEQDGAAQLRRSLAWLAAP